MPTKHNATGRNKYGRGRFILLDHTMVESDAYRHLSCKARALLIELNMQFNGSNNGQLFLSQRDAAERLGLKTHATAGVAFRELENTGFVRVRVKGSFTNKTRHATTYVLTQHDLGDNRATRDFMKWSPPAAKKPRAQKSRRSGAKKKPSVPSDWPDGCNDPPCNENSGVVVRTDYCSTYSIPGGGLTADEQRGAGDALAA